MKTTVKARNMELTVRLRSQIDRKLQRLDRIAHPDAEASVELSANVSRAAEVASLAEVTLLSNGSVLRSASSGPTPMAALDRLIDKLERQVIRARERPRAVRERQADDAEAVLAAADGGPDPSASAPEEVTPAPRVVKVKRFDMVPMFEEDAIAEMEELGHAFFVFLNAEGGGVCVVYRRADGGFGLIEPVINQGRRG